MVFYDVVGKCRYTPLSWCCKEGNVQMVSLLINAGAKPIKKNKDNMDRLNALECAANNDNVEMLSAIINHRDFADDYKLRISCLDFILNHCVNCTPEVIFDKLITIFTGASDEFYLEFASLLQSIDFLKFIFLKITNKEHLEKLSIYINCIVANMSNDLKIGLLNEAVDNMPYMFFCSLQKSVANASYKLLTAKILKDRVELSRFEKLRHILEEDSSFIDDDVLYEILTSIDPGLVSAVMYFFVDFLTRSNGLSAKCRNYILKNSNVNVLHFFLSNYKDVVLGDFSAHDLIALFIENDVISLSDKINLFLDMDICSIFDFNQCTGYDSHFLMMKIFKDASCRGVATNSDLKLAKRVIESVVSEKSGYRWDDSLFKGLTLDATVDFYKIVLLEYSADDLDMFYKLLSLLMNDCYIIDFESKLYELLSRYWGTICSSEENKDNFISFLCKKMPIEISNGSASMSVLYGLIGWLSNAKEAGHNFTKLHHVIASRLDNLGIHCFVDFLCSSDYCSILKSLLSEHAFKQIVSFFPIIQEMDVDNAVSDCWDVVNWDYLSNVIEFADCTEGDVYRFLSQLFASSSISMLEAFLYTFNFNKLDSLVNVRIRHIAYMAIDEWYKKLDSSSSSDLWQNIRFICGDSIEKLRMFSSYLGCSDTSVEKVDMHSILYMALFPYNHESILSALSSVESAKHSDHFLDYADSWFKNHVESFSKSEVDSLFDLVSKFCQSVDSSIFYCWIARLSDEELLKSNTPLTMLSVLSRSNDRSGFSDAVKKYLVGVFAKNPKIALKVLHDCLYFGISTAIDSELFDKFLSTPNLSSLLLQDFSLEIKNRLDKQYIDNYFKKIINCCNNNETLMQLLVKCNNICKTSNIEVYQEVCKHLVQLCFDRRNISLLAHIMLYSEDCNALVCNVINSDSHWSHFGHCLRYEMFDINNYINYLDVKDLQQQSPLTKILLTERPSIQSVLPSISLYSPSAKVSKYRVQVPSAHCGIVSLSTLLMLAIKENKRIEFNGINSDMISVNFPDYRQSFTVSQKTVRSVCSLSDSSGRRLLDNVVYHASLDRLVSLIVGFGSGLHEVLKDNALMLNKMNGFIDSVHFKVLEQGGVKSLCDFLHCITSHRIADTKSKAIEPDIKSKNSKGDELMSVLYKGFKKSNYGKQEKSYYAAMKNVCFFYELDEIWRLNLSFFARLHIACCFFYPLSILKSFTIFVAENLRLRAPVKKDDLKQQSVEKEIDSSNVIATEERANHQNDIPELTVSMPIANKDLSV
ncbi:hypothetical protein CAXC1_10011 [Candidatus Xenohaliotis californiensis]|uniref:Ankyrin repeat protein n=2 Tax=Candidatus Xenohaliotis californiensis TaxID=84677 RepID=A0ABP0EVR9_9RICK|nr:hypothetical protein CAXC1_10011 [Candidatus Xenohaliotis californiensis]